MSDLEEKSVNEIFDPLPASPDPDYPITPRALDDEGLEEWEEADYRKAITEFLSPEEEIVKAQDEAERAAKAQRNSTQDRIQWISDTQSSNEGWTYWYGHPDVRNVFYKTTLLDIGGGLRPEPNIVCSAVTINFGHRLAKHRLIGQAAPSWQFLGAGNKSGTIVFRAGNDAGRRTLAKIRKMYQIAQQNARLYKYVPDAQTFKIHHTDIHSSNNVNNVLALADIDRVIITNVEHQTDAGGVDLYTLVLDFITYEVTNEDMQLRTVFNLQMKFAMIRSLLKHLKSFQRVGVEAKGAEANTSAIFEGIDTIRNAISSLGEQGSIWQKLLQKTSGEQLASSVLTWDDEKASNIKTVLDFFARKQARHFISPKPSVLTWDDEKGWKPSKKYEGKEWFANLVLEAHRVVSKHRTDFPLLTTPIVGGQPGETWESKLENDLGPTAVELFGGSKDSIASFAALKGFHHRGVEQNHRMASKAYVVVTKKLDQIIRKAMKYVSDPDNFRSDDCFGEGVYNAIVENAVSQAGECYADLDLPEAPGWQGFRLDPEFYVYDDSMENAVLGASNDVNELEKMILSHIENEAKSLTDWTQRILFGGQGVSANMPRIRDTKLRLNEALGSEYGFLSFNSSKEQTIGPNLLNARGINNMMLAEGLKVWDGLVHDILDTVTGNGTRPQDKIYEKYIKSGEDEGGTIEQQRFNGYLNMVIDMTPHLKNYVDNRELGALNDTDKTNLKSTIKSSIYGQLDAEGNDTLPSSVKFGPNKEQGKQDSIMAGVPNPNAQETVGGINNPEAYTSDLTHPRDQIPGDPWEEVSGEISPVFDVPPPPVDVQNTQSPVETEATDTLWARQAASLAVGTRKRDLSMRRAYPTFKIYFIEEDTEQGNNVYRAFDDFYGYSSVQEIKVIRSRRIAADLAVIRMTNVGGNLLDRYFERSEKQREAEGEQAERPVGILADTKHETPFEKMMLQPGVKTQIRLGYSADPDQLETVFLGQITEVMPVEDGNIIEIVCQGYGAELESVQCGDLEDGPVAYSAQEALSAAIIKPEMVHFGRYDPNQFYSPAEVRSSMTGGVADDSFDPFANLKAWFRTSKQHDIRKYTFKNDPQDDNIYAPPITYYLDAWDTFWNNAAAYRPLLSTPWEIFKEHELRLPGYVSLAVPYGHSPRMTMFFGAKGQNYWSRPMSSKETALAVMFTKFFPNIDLHDRANILKDPRTKAKLQDLRRENPEAWKVIIQALRGFGGEKSIDFWLGRIFGRYRPFRNYHVYTSDHHILSNNVRTNAVGTYNTVEIRYSSDEDILEDQPSDIEQFAASALNVKLKEVQTGADGVYTTKLNDKIPEDLVRKYEESYPSCITEYMAQRYAQGLMIRGLRDVYRGEFCIIGDETLKPYDICMLQDNINDMHGPVEVEQVVQIFNADYGFISIVTPDLCVDFNEFVSKGVMDAIIQSMGLMWAVASKSTLPKVQKAIRMSDSLSAKFIGALSPVMGGAMLMHFDQTASPYIITPLHLGGRPMLGLVLAPKQASWFQNAWGDMKQYIEDLQEGWAVTDFTEDFFEWQRGAGEWVMDLFGAGTPNF